MISIALCIVFFFDLIIALLVPSTETMIFATDGTAARYAVDFVGLLIGFYALYNNGWKKSPSNWLLGFFLFMFVSHFHAINIHFEGAFIPSDMAIYDYKPMLECLIFFMMFMGIYSSKMELRDLEIIKRTIVWIAVIYGGFSILQRFHLDQFYKIMDIANISHMSRNPEVGGFICQPVFCAALLAMMLPFVIKTKSWWKISLVLLGIIATGNRSALIVCAIGALYLFNYRTIAKVLIGLYIAYLILGVIFYAMHINIPLFGEERFKIWHDVVADSIHSKCPAINNSHILTGIGIGAFPVIFPFFYTGWYQAHNEFLECIKCIGIIGFILIMKFASKIPRTDKTIEASLLSSFVLALTNATWHIPQLAFLTVLLIGLLFNMENAYGNSQPHGTR